MTVNHRNPVPTFYEESPDYTQTCYTHKTSVLQILILGDDKLNVQWWKRNYSLGQGKHKTF